jgi:hypothetical protein
LRWRAPRALSPVMPTKREKGGKVTAGPRVGRDLRTVTRYLRMRRPAWIDGDHIPI